MIRRGTAVFCAALFLCISSLAGCGSSNVVVSYKEQEGNITTLTFFGNKYEPENVVVIEDIISSFMNENPGIRVSYESIKGNEYYEALKKRIEAGRGDDIFMVNHDIILELESLGKVADLSGLSSIQNYTDNMLSQMDENGKVYWIPTTVSMFGLYCNLDILKKHGQDIPETLAEWEDVCGYFASQGITPIVANNDISLKTLAIGKGLFSVYQENRQKEVFERLNNGEEKLSSYLRPGFSIVEDFIEKRYIDPAKAIITNKTSDDLKEFVKGESPFMLTGAWAAGRMEGMNPDFSYKVVPLPVLADGSLIVINADTRLSVNADSNNMEAAMQFVEYFTSKENIQKFADQQSSFSPLKGGNLSPVSEIQTMLLCYESGRTVIGADALLDLPIWNITEEVSKKLLRGEPLEAAMEWMDCQAEAERSTD